MSTDGMLKMSELAQRSGVSAGTIKHYLREGVLGPDHEVVRTSRNMAWYPESFVARIQLVKRLQEQRFMPLRVIRELVGADPDRAARLVELEDRIAEHADELRERGRVSRAVVRDTYELPANVLERLQQLDVLSPTRRGYDADDVAIIEAISRFRAGGYEQALGFTVYDVLRYRDRAGAARPRGGRGAARAPVGRARRRACGPDRRVRCRAAARADRRDALQAAAGRTAPPGPRRLSHYQ